MEAAIQKDDTAAQSAATARSAAHARSVRSRIALTLEQRYSKQQILEGYLNIAAFGPSTCGVRYSALLLAHSAKDLADHRVGAPGGPINAPGAYDPIAYPDQAEGRMNWVWTRCTRRFITDEEWRADLQHSRSPTF